MDTRLAALQEAVDHLYSSLSTLRAGDSMALGQPLPTEKSTPISRHSVNTGSPPVIIRPSYRQPRFQGPTSSAFNLDVAKNTLQNMGYSGVAEGGDGLHTQDDTPLDSPPLRTQPLPVFSRDPLWSLSGNEAVRLCNVYHEEMVRTRMTAYFNMLKLSRA